MVGSLEIRQTYVDEIEDEISTIIACNYGQNGTTPLQYHNIEHFYETKISTTIIAKELEASGQISAYEVQDALLTTYGHDVRYQVGDTPHNELMSGAIIRKQLLLPRYGNFFTDSAERIEKNIGLTAVQFETERIIQSPDKDDILSKLMCDIDLGSLGMPLEYAVPRTAAVVIELSPDATSRAEKIDLILPFLLNTAGVMRNHDYFLPESEYLFRHLDDNSEAIDYLYRYDQTHLINLALVD